MAGNRGVTDLRLKRRATDPMRVYDGLPPALRGWLAQAVLPWSPTSCRAIWRRALAGGASEAEILDRLDRAERATLDRERRRAGHWRGETRPFNDLRFPVSPLSSET